MSLVHSVLALIDIAAAFAGAIQGPLLGYLMFFGGLQVLALLICMGWSE